MPETENTVAKRMGISDCLINRCTTAEKRLSKFKGKSIKAP